ncbi:MAG: hypothetical protein OEZ36_02860 [Spirochaetota bacterium]|nr:hypothetical protein [Spirochaetota bacterium]
MLKLLNIIVITFFSIVIFSQIFALGIGVKIDSIENRRLAKWPINTASDLMRLDMGKKLSAFWRDIEPIRSTYIRLHNYLVYFLLNDSPNEKVSIGKNDWLFHSYSILKWPCHKKAKPKLLIKLFNNFIESSKRVNKMPLIVFSPSKASIYPEFLSDVDRKIHLSCAITNRDKYIDYISNTSQSINLWKIFLKEKTNLLKKLKPTSYEHQRLRYLFRPRDVHWGEFAGFIQAREITNKLTSNIWSFKNTDLFNRKFIKRNGEIAKRFLNIKLPEIYLDKKRTKINSIKNLKLVKAGRHKVLGYITNKKRYDKRTVLIIHDSFMNRSKKYLSEHFKKTYYIHWNIISNNFDECKQFIKESDIIVIQTYEDHKMFRIKGLNNIITYFTKYQEK